MMTNPIDNELPPKERVCVRILRGVVPIALGTAITIAVVLCAIWAATSYRDWARRPSPNPILKGPPDQVTGFGDHRTVRIIMLNVDGLDVTAKIRQIAPRLTDPDADGRSWGSSERSDRTFVVTLAPVADLDAFVRRIDFGTVGAIDREWRTVTVTVDRSKFAVAKPK